MEYTFVSSARFESRSSPSACSLPFATEVLSAISVSRSVSDGVLLRWALTGSASARRQAATTRRRPEKPG
jgi:hypothetical protein